MEDSIDVILQDPGRVCSTSRPHLVLSACTGALLTGLYGVWRMFCMPGSRKIPLNLLVPYLPSSKGQTMNIMQLLKGRTGRLADLGSGDGRLVFAASSAGFRCTGQVTFVKKDFWKTDLSSYNNVTAFLSPGLMEVLGEKLLKELPDDACVIAARFPFPYWPLRQSVGSDLDETFAYDISTVRSHLRKGTTIVEY
ncbi:hypothetical protein CesoFtcFv8_003695 [Champsocephalus esox]|uniref:Uncharacterized protein n=1 Tax=Champsocephalus esox TaxID=159716 RepID=A0AAN8CX87_9TELE|nr:hypothetical protein CesoFtcFv8_003695 [Champsocephalus esox]